MLTSQLNFAGLKSQHPHFVLQTNQDSSFFLIKRGTGAGLDSSKVTCWKSSCKHGNSEAFSQKGAKNTNGSRNFARAEPKNNSQGLVNVPMFHITQLKRGDFISRYLMIFVSVMWNPQKGHQSQPLLKNLVTKIGCFKYFQKMFTTGFPYCRKKTRSCLSFILHITTCGFQCTHVHSSRKDVVGRWPEWTGWVSQLVPRTVGWIG